MLRAVDTIWTRIALGLVLAQIAAAVFLPRGPVLTYIGDTLPCVLTMVVMLSFGSNRRRSNGTVRLFWMLNEVAFGILFLSQFVWFWYEIVLQKPAPTPVAGDGLFLLALVPTLASLALSPQAEYASENLKLRRLDFLLLLCWWVCLYLYFALPWQFVIQSYPNYNPAYYSLALAEHGAVLVAVATLHTKSQGAWKRFYAQFLFSFCCFAAGSLLQNYFIDRGVYYTGGFYDVPWGFSLGLLTVAAALGGKLESPAGQSDLAPQNKGVWSARLAMIGVISLPLLAIATVFNSHVPHSIVVFRLRLIFGAMLFLGTLTFLKLSWMDRELLRLIHLTESSMESLKLVQNQLSESQKMAALGRLAYGATHEISNPLTAILGYSELLRENPSLTQEDRRSVEDIQHQVHQAQSAINGIRKFGRSEPEALESHLSKLNRP
jgi:His Kinase A (phospho-acceptor) domain